MHVEPAVAPVSAPLSRPSLVAADIAAAPIRAFLTQLDAREMAIHSLHVVRNDQLALDLWRWPHEPNLPHTLHSITKSFTGTAVGFAIAEGLLALDDLVAPFFEGRFPSTPDANMQRMRIRDLLTMQTGNTREISGSTTRLRTDGWINDFLAEPVQEAPGARFMYSSMSSHALSAIVQQVTGMSVADYLRPRLFEPLGIHDFQWQADPDGVSSGGNGLSLRPVELLEFGLLYLHDGMRDGQRILPAGWAHEASLPHASRPGGGYGYQFWCFPGGAYSASGIFGQECMIFPEYDAVVSITGAMGNGSYHDLPDLMHDAFREAFETGASGTNQDADERWIADRIAADRLPEVLPSEGGPTQADASFSFAPNDQGLESIRIETGPDTVVVELHDDRGIHRIEHGRGTWLPGHTSASVWRLHHSYQDDDASVFAGAKWTGDTHLTLRWVYPESTFDDTIELEFADEDVVFQHRSNANSGPSELPAVAGRR